MSSRDSYQCYSQQVDEEEDEGFIPTSIWKKRKRKDFSDEQDYETSEEVEEEEEDIEYVTNELIHLL
jgi:hypothetical protein